MAIYMKEEIHYETIMTNEAATTHPKSNVEQEQPGVKRSKSEVFCEDSPRCGEITTSWSRVEENFSLLQSF